MSAIFQPQYWLLWSLILTVLLFFPIRKIIWVLSVRRAQRKIDEVDPQEQQRLRRRAGVTAVLLSFLFSISYTGYLFGAGS
jgi:cytochrome c-type biogenesis protein CcmH/NrfF